MAPIRKYRRSPAPFGKRPQGQVTTLGCAAGDAAASSGVIESPAHINRLAWAWLREFQQDLQDDCDNRLEANNQ